MKKIFSMAVVGKVMMMALFASVLIAPLAANAEIKAGSVEVNPFAGYSFFEKSQNLKDSIIYGGRLGYNFTRNFGIEGTVEFVNSGVDDKSKTGAKEGQYRSPMSDVDLAFYHIDAVYHFMPEGKFNPFIVAGIGGAHYHPRIADQDMTVIDFGVGAKYWLSDNIALRADVRDNMVSEVFKHSYHNVNITAGLVFAFGGKSNTESAVVAKPEPEAIPVVNTAPATVVAAKDTTPPSVTLVNPFDNSTDVPTHREMRIAFSEAMDPATINTKTFSLHQGKTPVPGKVTIPTKDTASFTQANELIPDTTYTGRITTGVKDLAGNALESDYVWSFKTAPVPDPQIITKVKTKVETKVVVVNKFVLLTGTHFAFDSAALAPAGKELIRQNIRLMKDDADIKVRIAGHTSAAGSTKYNQALSERRANVVRDFIINEGGIAPERLETIGYGETRPVMKEVNPKDHGSKAAKANMRVVFEIMEK